MNELTKALAEQVYGQRICDFGDFNNRLDEVKILESCKTIDETRIEIAKLVIDLAHVDEAQTDGLTTQERLLKQTEIKIVELTDTIKTKAVEKYRLETNPIDTGAEANTIAQLDTEIVKYELLFTAYQIQYYVLTGEMPGQ